MINIIIDSTDKSHKSKLNDFINRHLNTDNRINMQYNRLICNLQLCRMLNANNSPVKNSLN